MYHYGVSFVDGKSKNAPRRFVARNIATCLVFRNFINAIITGMSSKDTLVGTLVNVLENVSYRFYGVTTFNIYVGIKHLQKQRTVRYDPPIINHHTIWYYFHSCGLSTIFWLPSSVQQIAIRCKLHFLDELTRIHFTAIPFFQAC
ncbi:hypothetical protein AVEN_155256-1 [Araneus ventricosus]|uniref:Uncharacterized protein n=1 Tax=Araneus ventricosus TaxID=182803 RepID=A0A4Y2D7M1_ARAVE|nr:hypothetical protein AVEN_155256-1 [Araneus ventricosus]